MDGIGAIQSRIAAIEARIGQLSSASWVGGDSRVAMSSGSSSVDFGAVLASMAVPTLDGSAGAGASLVNADNVPLEYLGYGNGKIPAAALSQISGTSHELWAPAARSFEAMRSAAAADGVTLGITDSYRSYDAQVDVAARKGLYSQGGLAATPGTSNHGWGMALDLSLDSGALAWLRQHGGEYGFEESVPRESWHWEYHPTH